MPLRALKALVWASVLVMTGCGGSGDGQPLPPSVVEHPPAGGSRWVSLGMDQDGDGLVDRLTLFAYGADGRRELAEVYAASAGVREDLPQLVTQWMHDSDGRVASTVHSEPALGDEVTTTFTYGPDGLLASSIRVPTPPAPSAHTAFTWDEERLTSQVVTIGASTTTSEVFYGDDGRVARVEHRQGAAVEPDVDTYTWRPDGQLDSATYRLAVGNLIRYTLSYDADDRQVRMLKTDDGLDELEARYHYDARGRLMRVDIDLQPEGLDEVDQVLHIVWEDGLCQPVYLPQLPPEFDRHVTGQASASNVSPGCAP